MESQNVLILCHGMITDLEAGDHRDSYGAFIKALISGNDLGTSFGIEDPDDWDDPKAAVIGVEYAHEPDTPRPLLRSDQKLTRAQAFVLERVALASLRDHQSPDDHFLSFEITAPLQRWLYGRLRDAVMTLGMGDAIYYASPDGERAVRYAVYEQVLSRIDAYRDADEVRLHVVAHSLGATVMFDFLFGLFASNEVYSYRDPDFTTDAKIPDHLQESYRWWRKRAAAGGLRLGSLVTMGGQLHLFFLRKQKLVDRFYDGKLLDPTVIGVPKEGAPVWYVLYDADDLLGYPVRALFDATGSIQQHQVNVGAFVPKAHTEYWRHDKVQRLIRELMLATSDRPTVEQ